jgi:hypothetical protein
MSPTYTHTHSSRIRHSCCTHVEVVSLALELGRCIDLVCHNPRDGLLYVLHPLKHLHVSHFVDFFDEVVVLLPERHLESCCWRSPVYKEKDENSETVHLSVTLMTIPPTLINISSNYFLKSVKAELFFFLLARGHPISSDRGRETE